MFYLFDGRAGTQLQLETWEAGGADGETMTKTRSAEVSGLAEIQPGEDVLTIWNKFRGPGDCGSWTAYSISPRGATVKELRAKLKCDGIAPSRPQDMPLIALPQ